MQHIWHKFINKTCDINHIKLDPYVKHYLLITLEHYQTSENLHQDILGCNLLKANTLPTVKKNELLRKTGDTCLIMAGFFPKKQQSMLVSNGYYIQVGKTAYRHISQDKNNVNLDGELYQQLDYHFLTMVYVIRRLQNAN